MQSDLPIIVFNVVVLFHGQIHLLKLATNRRLGFSIFIKHVLFARPETVLILTLIFLVFACFFLILIFIEVEWVRED